MQADSGGAPIWGINCQGVDGNDRAYGAIQNFHGGQGGRAGFDGNDTLSFPSNCKVTPIEIYELSVPVVIERKELIPDSGGAGKFRGGLGQLGVLRNISTAPMNMFLNTERVYHPCFGVLGGGDGRAGKVEKDGEAIFPKGKIILQPGETLTIETPGGGGWGKPGARSPELIAQDLREGLTTAVSHSRDFT